MQKKRLVKRIEKEYWEGICPVCGYVGPPLTFYFEEERKTQIKVICPRCDLTINYKMPRVQHKYKSAKKIDRLNPLPSLFNSC
ncbi:MAG: hypothetical protein DRP02_06525 [Candidatus Gerdarchaeota archaeon]|nr:MAG: hypothetical protein DRO63_03450 [Candidatus Gerdarchaeota archaeon]RLI70859.1 MAG: hypothetical protein DRP02_06525 [Candidatus Gerdarchaeota archaeon]